MRCFICDYSGSADSIYNEGVQSKPRLNNYVVYSPEHAKEICVACLEEHFAQKGFWASIDNGEEVNVPEIEADDPAEYAGCTEIDCD